MEMDKECRMKPKKDGKPQKAGNGRSPEKDGGGVGRMRKRGEDEEGWIMAENIRDQGGQRRLEEARERRRRLEKDGGGRKGRIKLQKTGRGGRRTEEAGEGKRRRTEAKKD